MTKKCSMQKKKESLEVKAPAKCSMQKKKDTTDVISVKLEELRGITDADKVLVDLKELGFNTIDYGDYASKDKAYAVLKHPNGMYVELDYTWERDASGRDSYNPGEVLEYEYFKDKADYEDIHGYSPRESKQSKKSEGAIGDTIKMNIDYNTFMRLLDSAAYLSGDTEYHDALWDYYSDFGEMSTKADEFFDNLFQYTDWCDVDEMYDEHISDDYKDDSKSREECVAAAIEAGDVNAQKYGDHYLVLN